MAHGMAARTAARTAPHTTPTDAALDQPHTAIYFTELRQLDRWAASRHDLSVYDRLRISREHLAAYHREPTQGTKRLHVQIVHDFKNGYQDGHDMNPIGYFPARTTDYYRMQFPGLCDQFVYFSHHRISVPPIAWVNQCHRNGIACLGTLIFEGDTPDDLAELDALVQPGPDGSHYRYVQMLVQLCEHYNFDGFLVNLETRFSRRELARHVEPFLLSLRAELALANSHSSVVWYDAYVPELNRVEYGNGVTDANYPLLAASGAMLTNYWWTERHLAANAELAGSRAHVAVGLDVWGRGMKYGSGGFDLPVALEKLVQHTPTRACGIFAPAWTFENFDPRLFEQNDTKFWIGAASAAGHSVADLVGSYTSTVHVPSANNFIFYTNFSQGKGAKFFENGALLLNKNWVNGSLVFEVPQVYYEQSQDHVPDTDLKFELYHKDAFHLGTSLKVEKLLEDEVSTSRLLLKKFSGGDRIRKQLFRFHHEVHADMALRVNYKFLSSTRADNFSLVVGFEVSNPLNISRTSEVRVQIHGNGNRWSALEETVRRPIHSRLESVFLKTIALEFQELPGSDAPENRHQDWVVVESQKTQLKYKNLRLLIGDISLSSLAVANSSKLSGLSCSKDGPDGKFLVKWDESKDPLYWNVLVDGRFWGTAVVPYVILDGSPSRVRVDIVNRDGECIVGDSVAF